MAEEGASNIFDEAKRMGSKEKKKIRPGSRDPSKEGPSPSEEEVSKMLKRMEEMRDEIEKKLDKAYERSSITAGDVKGYLDDPKNFANEKQWKIVQTSRDDLVKEIWSNLGKGAEKKREAKKLKKAVKKRKGKALGSRRKWIPMD